MGRDEEGGKQVSENVGELYVSLREMWAQLKDSWKSQRKRLQTWKWGHWIERERRGGNFRKSARKGWERQRIGKSIHDAVFL